MGIIGSVRRKKIPGHKMTTSKELFLLSNDSITRLYIPLVYEGKPLEQLVQIGDNVKKGTLIAKRVINDQNRFEVPLYSPVSGSISAIEELFSPHSGRKIKHLVIENDFKNTQQLLPKLVNDNSTREEVVDLIKNAGIVGLGGAGFPTYVKYSQVVDTVLINGVECEPYLTSDYFAMSNAVEELLEGIMLLIKAAGAQRAVIAVKKNKVELLAKIREKINSYSQISLQPVPDVYPMGWERTLVRQVFKKDYNRFPSEIGVIVNNAQTAIAVYRALVRGEVISERIVTVSGAIKNCANVLVPLGTRVDYIVAELGGYCGEKIHLIPGGPMMGKAAISDEFALTATMGALTVLTEQEIKETPCLRCGQCIQHCPAGIMPVNIMEAVIAKNVPMMIKLCANDCIECGLCSYICPARIELTEYVKKAKTQIRIHETKQKMAKGGVK